MQDLAKLKFDFKIIYVILLAGAFIIWSGFEFIVLLCKKCKNKKHVRELVTNRQKLVICESYLRELNVEKLKEYYLRTLKNYVFTKT